MPCYCSRVGIDVSYEGPTLPIQQGDTLWVIFGSRAFADLGAPVDEQARWVLHEFSARELPFPDVILSGGAGGADAVAEEVALELDVPMIVFSVGAPSLETQQRELEADQPWVVETVTRYRGDSDNPRSGNGAYLTRNCMMAEVTAQHDGYGFAIYNGSSNGTEHMLDSCQSHGVDTTVWHYLGE